MQYISERRTTFLAVLLSLLLHLLLLWFVNTKHWLDFNWQWDESQPQELQITFPENKPEPKTDKPREVVQNENFNDAVPDQSNLLSDRNSRARNPEKSEETGQQPRSEGNTPLNNLSEAPAPDINSRTTKRFSKEALRGHTHTEASERSKPREGAEQPESQPTTGSNQRLQQQETSVEEVGGLTLSTYQWNWAPYVNAMRNKLMHVWYTPPAYNRLGLIHGYTILNFAVTRNGEMRAMEVVRHEGHQSLKESSMAAIRGLFPLPPLPDDFPEKELQIQAKLIYPDLRRRR